MNHCLILLYVRLSILFRNVHYSDMRKRIHKMDKYMYVSSRPEGEKGNMFHYGLVLYYNDECNVTSFEY